MSTNISKLSQVVRSQSAEPCGEPLSTVETSLCSIEQTAPGPIERGFDDEAIDYWERTLQDGLLCNLPLDRLRPPRRSFSGATYRASVARSTIEGLLRRCRRECGSSEAQVLRAAFAVLVSRYAGQDTVALGTTVEHRRDGQHQAVGCLTGMVPLKLTLSEVMSFRELLSQTAAAERLIQRYAVAYPQALDKLGPATNQSYNPAFQVALAVSPTIDLDLGKDTICTHEPRTPAALALDLQLRVRAGNDTIDIAADFNTDLFDASTVERLVRHYVQLLERLADDIDVPVGKVSFLPEDERRSIVEVWNQTRVDYPRTTVVDMIEAQVERTPAALRWNLKASRSRTVN